MHTVNKKVVGVFVRFRAPLYSALSIKKDKRVPKIVNGKYIIRHQLIGLLLIWEEHPETN
jgi:hypothetical protein